MTEAIMQCPLAGERSSAECHPCMGLPGCNVKAQWQREDMPMRSEEYSPITSNTAVIVVPRPMGVPTMVLRYAVPWAVTIGALYASQAFLGGSWVVNVVAFIMLLLTLFAQANQAMNKRWTMLSTAQANRWFRDGAPMNVRRWLKEAGS